MSVNRKVLLVFMAVWAAMLGSLLGRIYLLRHPAAGSPPAEKPLEAVGTSAGGETERETDRYWTVAVFGLDSRNGSLGKGNQSDMEMVCSIDMKTGEIRLVSVYRDTYLKIGEGGEYNKVNQAYCEGGPSQAIRVLEENLDLEIDDYASFNWKAVVDAVNLLGGIDLEVSKAEFKVINGFITETVESTGVPSQHLKRAGWNHLDGVQAVAYARLRKMDTDFKRTERQRKVAELVMEKARLANFSVINHILVSVLPQISTSIGFGDVLPLAKNLRKFHLGQTAGFPFDLKDAMVGRKDCVIPVDLEKNVKKLHEFLFDDTEYVPPARVRKIGSEIKARAAGRGSREKRGAGR